jgi:hypothetical protein
LEFGLFGLEVFGGLSDRDIVLIDIGVFRLVPKLFIILVKIGSGKLSGITWFTVTLIGLLV